MVALTAQMLERSQRWIASSGDLCCLSLEGDIPEREGIEAIKEGLGRCCLLLEDWTRLQWPRSTA